MKNKIVLYLSQNTRKNTEKISVKIYDFYEQINNDIKKNYEWK